MKHSTRWCLILAMVMAVGVHEAQAIPGARKAAIECIEALGEFVARRGGRGVAEELAELGGEAAVRELAERTLREGGERAGAALIRRVKTVGPDAIRAASNAPNVPKMLNVIDELPAEDVVPAIRRLAAGPQGESLARAVHQHGAIVLKAELKHPGIGGTLVRQFGDEGFDLAERLGRDHALILAQHADDIGRLPLDQRSGVLQLFRDRSSEMAGFIGRFVQDNPVKVLFTATAVTALLAYPDEILDGKIQLDANGNIVSSPGLIDRTIQRVVDSVVGPVLKVLLPIGAFGLLLLIAIRSWSWCQQPRIQRDAAVLAARAKVERAEAAASAAGRQE